MLLKTCSVLLAVYCTFRFVRSCRLGREYHQKYWEFLANEQEWDEIERKHMERRR